MKSLMPLLLILSAVSELLCKKLQLRDISPAGDGPGQLHAYSREFLLSLRNNGDTPPKHLPEDIRCKRGSDRPGRRKRGRRGGIRQRLRRRANKPPLPTMILSNVRSLCNKMDELRLLSRHCHEFREASIMVLTESWLRMDIPNNLIQLDGFSCVRADREATSELKHHYQGNNSTDVFTATWNAIMTTFDCCGVNGGEDFEESLFRLLNPTKMVPEACCQRNYILGNVVLLSQEDCVKGTLLTRHKGCYSAVVEYFETYIYLAGALAIVVLTIELFAMVFAMCLFRGIQ